MYEDLCRGSETRRGKKNAYCKRNEVTELRPILCDPNGL